MSDKEIEITIEEPCLKNKLTKKVYEYMSKFRHKPSGLTLSLKDYLSFFGELKQSYQGAFLSIHDEIKFMDVPIRCVKDGVEINIKNILQVAYEEKQTKFP